MTLNFSTLIPVAAFGGVVAMIWLLIDWMNGGRRARAEERLDEWRDPMIRRRKEEGPRNTTQAMTRVLEKATPALAKPLQPASEKDASRLKQRLMQAGFRRQDAPTVFLGLKFLCLCLGFTLGGGGLLVFGTGVQTLLRCGGLACILFFIPDVLLALIGSQRKQMIFLGLPDALDLMVVCVEAGLGLDQAMRKVSEEMKKTYRVIAEEFGLCNLQMQMGKGRADALQDLGNRSGVDDLRALASILIQADKFGSSIAQALRVQSDSMRTRRRQIAEEKAAKTAVKLIFPLVIFIFPGIFVVLVGPAAIEMYRKMFTAMNGG
ncbi:MAG: type II secretion system F family protein [Pirellulaceae bacterium]